MKQREMSVESVTETPELRIKSLHFTPEPTITGASSLLLMVPFSRIEAPSIMAQFPILTFFMLPQFTIFTFDPTVPVLDFNEVA
ncbi:hypothetical protein SDC9_173322 [bioreactor metagenome]|uniref:Uncharacterized protein n=1 Tax=bioreactor metagenome TaxID=1076179 RepID=A0A645GG26_9ZZZZ